MPKDRYGRRRRYGRRSRQDFTCFKNGGAGTAMLEICWFAVAMIAIAVGGVPGTTGRVIITRGIEGTPRPMSLNRGVDAVGVPTAAPVAKSTAACPLHA